MDYINFQQEPKPDKKTFIVSVVGVLFTIAAFALQLKGHPVLMGISAVAGVVLIGYAMREEVLRPFHAVKRLYCDWRFVAKNEPLLSDFFARLRKLTDKTDGNQIVPLATSVLGSVSEKVGEAFPTLYIEDWLKSYEFQLKYPATNYRHFLERCHEFTALIVWFNKDYVSRCRKVLLAQEKPPSEREAKQLATYTMNFNRFLEDVDLWLVKVNEYSEERQPYPKFIEVVSYRDFDRLQGFVKPEAKAEAVKAAH